MDRNNHVDYVIRYSFADTDTQKAIDQLERLLRRLHEVGLQSEVREADESSLFVFVRASNTKSLRHAVYQSRIRDWLHGVRNTEPEQESEAEPQTEAERLRVIYHMITVPREAGGAGIIPEYGEWKNVTAVFPLHDDETNKECMRDWSSKTFLTPEDLDKIRNSFGESVGFYFAFLQSYFRFLMFPAAFGFSCWILLGSFSTIYTVVNALWCIVFIEYWKRQEEDLSCRWQTRGVSLNRPKRLDFKPEREVRDARTGEIKGVFPIGKRMQRQLLQVPFTVVAAIGLGVIIATCFAIEIFISEIYNGPFKGYLVFIPTILLSALIPTMTAVLVSVATRLNDYENYETQFAYDAALTQKIFIINFITSYLPIVLTAFVYLPFASYIVPYLDVFQLTVRPFVSKEHATTARTKFSINPDRLRKQVIYFTVTAQAVNFAQETIVPILKQRFAQKYKEYQRNRNKPVDDDSTESETQRKSRDIPFQDDPNETKFLNRVRNEADLADYDVTDDLREMCIQFGYLALFAPIWPLVPVSFLVNNWVELRSDFFKICIECKRPWPQRAETIGPWLESLGFLSWVGSITSSALVYMFSNNDTAPDGQPSTIKGWALLLTIFFSEHLYLFVRYAVRAGMSKLEPPNVRKERTERYMMRRRYLESTLLTRSASDDDESEAEQPPADADSGVDLSQITRKTLEEDAREWTRHGTDPAEKFWQRQKGWRESAHVASAIVRELTSHSAKESKESKKEL
ncbi:hypothetical protein FE257_007963 [Aspergillus nanangensis]|uniref:Plasma membrane channel protein n=1 Tax=Aspergillus nanangensis TaxID=2582783 RepID=A0AAD4GZ75_ASPNN|nr:hypothetical protein FE257_007963 [Aspergillus nanangensis]